MKIKGSPRRDRLVAASNRMFKLNGFAAAYAWYHLSGALEGMGDMDVPKFETLLGAVRRATIRGAQHQKNSSLCPPPNEKILTASITIQ